jgi:hypothetical protein
MNFQRTLLWDTRSFAANNHLRRQREINAGFGVVLLSSKPIR